jgi:hypothetical protein
MQRANRAGGEKLFNVLELAFAYHYPQFSARIILSCAVVDLQDLYAEKRAGGGERGVCGPPRRRQRIFTNATQARDK